MADTPGGADVTDSTNRVPDADPAASSMPRIPTYWSETIGRRVTIPDEVVPERHDEPSADDSYEHGRVDGAVGALRRVERALRWCTAAEVRATLQALRGGPDYLDAVLRSLDALADQAVQRGDHPCE